MLRCKPMHPSCHDGYPTTSCVFFLWDYSSGLGFISWNKSPNFGISVKETWKRQIPLVILNLYIKKYLQNIYGNVSSAKSFEKYLNSYWMVSDLKGSQQRVFICERGSGHIWGDLRICMQSFQLLQCFSLIKYKTGLFGIINHNQ